MRRLVCLNGVGHGLLPVDEFLDHLLRDGDSCGVADKNNTMNIETLLHGTHGVSEMVHFQFLKQCFRQQEKEINAVEKGVDLDGRSRIRRQGAFGVFTLCPETDIPSLSELNGVARNLASAFGCNATVTGLTNHGFNALNSDAVMRESQETS